MRENVVSFKIGFVKSGLSIFSSLCLCVELSKEGFVYEKTKKDQLVLEEAFLQTVGGNYNSCSISTATEVF